MANERDGRKNAVSRLVQAVEGSREFLEWRKGNKRAHLSSVFAMGKSAGQLNEWLLSYYDEKDDTFTTFSTTGSLTAAKEQAFKKGKAVPVLEAGSVKVEVHDSLRIAENVRAGSYKDEEASTVIAILQPLTPEEVSGGSENGSTGGNSSGKESEARARPVWNITYITGSFNVINIKIDAETGKVLNHRISGVMDFMQKDQKGK
ncbi:hypothetical protein HYV85_06220 [Candidatus Woesearchaeota archaeon]|nr:hypothetical protein [Candidatus Woesearchaeota archaeon]